ncbi:MAG: VOC family protein [Negativicutes bacterium]|nr:VOC family protein [Negativicutes bacterium]
MRIHHIGYLVKRLEDALEEFLFLGYEIVKESKYYEDMHQSICFVSNGGYMVELICPIDPESAAWRLLKRYKNAPYHICYETENIRETAQKFVDRNYVLLGEPFKTPAIDNREVCFLINESAGMIELIETEKKNDKTRNFQES